MYKATVSVFIALLLATVSSGQTEPAEQGPVKTGKYKVMISFTTKSGFHKKAKGFPVVITDSGLLMTSGYYKVKNKEGRFEYKLRFIKAEDINRIYFRRKGIVGWGILGGSVAGFITGGAIASSAVSKNPSPNPGFINVDGLRALPGFMIGLSSGAVIGGFTASKIRKKFVISGNTELFLMYKEKMYRYVPDTVTH